SGWYTGIAVADVNGDGRPDVFVAGYSDLNSPVPNSIAGFPTNVSGVRDLLFLGDGARGFREVGVAAGLEAAAFSHGLGAQFMDVNGDGRPDLYVANDEDPNALYVNVPWPGGLKADPTGLGFRFEERAAAAGVADPFAGMGIAAAGGRLFVTNSRGEASAAYLRTGSRFANIRPLLDPALGTGFAGWGASWVDLQNSGRPDLVLTAGAIPVTNLKSDAEPVRVLAPTSGSKYGDDRGVLQGPITLNGRGLAAADANNDGRMQIAINTIGGRLVLLRPSRASGHWVDVALSRFSPGAVVTVVLPDGTRLSREVTAGSSYLSSEDPRVHFGLGRVTRIARLIVRFPSGAVTRLNGVPADRVVSVLAPAVRRPAMRAARTATLAACIPATRGRSVARIWDDAAVAVLRAAGAPEPVQARDLYDVSAAVARAYVLAKTPAGRDAAISYAAYRLLVWQASFEANLRPSFALLTNQLRALCYSPDYTTRSGGGGGALGNRIGLAAINTYAHDGANEQLHFADPTFTPRNQPLIVAQSGSTVHDATFWQPLALAQFSPRGSGSVPAQVQSFVGSQWGDVRAFAGKIAVGAPALGDPSGKTYREAAIAAIRATAEPFARSALDTSPAAWNASLPSLGLKRDVQLDLALNGALNDAAVSIFGAKRAYEAPRPISMIRYLAFNGQLPIVPGLTRRVGKEMQVRAQGRWVAGDRWTPPVQTPASPGYPSADAAFASAADTVLTALTGRSYAARAAQAAALAAREGVELPQDATAGTRVGRAVGARALAHGR
ncbi:MAG TPA: ASPIC/UnbV domain-containing protein, partial [Gaiellaceae bacterium]|nr:ASPIC/UnbV domain-containing protein [Gaiellaceae bacterium]